MSRIFNILFLHIYRKTFYGIRVYNLSIDTSFVRQGHYNFPRGKLETPQGNPSPFHIGHLDIILLDFHRVDADAQFLCNLFSGKTVYAQFDNLLLTRGKSPICR